MYNQTEFSDAACIESDDSWHKTVKEERKGGEKTLPCSSKGSQVSHPRDKNNDAAATGPHWENKRTRLLRPNV